MEDKKIIEKIEKETLEILEILNTNFEKDFKKMKLIQEMKESEHVQNKATEYVEYMYSINKIYCEKDDLKKLEKSVQETTKQCIETYKKQKGSKIQILLDILQGELMLLNVLSSTKKIENDFDGLKFVAKELHKLAEVADYIIEKEEK